MRYIKIIILTLISFVSFGQQKIQIKLPPKVDSIYRKPGQDSIFYTINSIERAIKDSVGGGGSGVTSDSLAWRRVGITQRINTVGWMNTYNGTVGASAAGNAVDSANLIWGARSGQSLTTGYRNIAIGRAALKTSTTGHSNIAIGDSTMSLGNVSGTINVAIGQSALRSNTTGSLNVAIGNETLFSASTVSSHIAIGNGALKNKTAGSGAIIAIGTSSMFNHNNGSASDIVAIGRESMRNLTAGSQNVAIGLNAGYTWTTGSNNVHIGTGSNTAGSTTANNTIFIGASGGTLAGNHTGTLYLSGGGTSYTLGDGTTTVGFLSNRSTGSFNTAIGYQTLATKIGILAPTNENGATAIGYQAGSVYSLSAGSASIARSNSVYIGFRAGGNPTGGVGDKDYTGQELIAIGFESAILQEAGNYNTAIGRVNLANTTGSNQLAIGGNGIGWIRQDVDGSLRRTLLNATTADVTTFTPSTALEINGTNGAVLLPRLTTAQRDALTPTNGMILYNTTTSKLQAYAGGAWVDLH